MTRYETLVRAALVDPSARALSLQEYQEALQEITDEIAVMLDAVQVEINQKERGGR